MVAAGTSTRFRRRAGKLQRVHLDVQESICSQGLTAQNTPFPMAILSEETMKKVMKMLAKPGLDAVALLKADHRKVKGLFHQFAVTRTNARRHKLLDEILMELTIHTTIEERHLYPVLAQQDDDAAKEAVEEHHVVKLVIAELEGYDGTEDNIKAKVKVLSELVGHHIEEEEQELFPELKKAGVDLKVIGEKLQQEKQKLMRESKLGGKKAVTRKTTRSRTAS